MVDEEFTHWGGEDNEFGYRLYRKDVTFGLLKEQWHIIKNHPERKRDGSCGREKYYCSIVTAKVPYFYRKKEKIESATLKRVH